MRVVHGDLVAGTAQMSYDQFIKEERTIGSWCEVKTEQKIYYCRLWPAAIQSNQIVIDSHVSKYVGDAKEDGNPEVLSLTTLTPPPCLQITVHVMVRSGSEKQQLHQYGFVYDQGTPLQKTETIRQLLQGLVVTQGCLVQPTSPSKQPPLTIQVVAMHLANEPSLVVSGTRIDYSEVPCKKAAAAPDSIDQLQTSMTALTVKDEPTPKTGKPFGLERAYDALIEMISYPFSHQQSLATLGIECPKGILLYGPPGVGKTFLVSSVANQYGAKLLVIHGPELYGPYVGESEEKLRLRFKQAQDLASDGSHPVILFIDEIDALTPRREQAQSHENRMVAQLLTLMDGTVKQGKFVVVGATNRPNAIDPALRRPGRFDREVHVDAPDTATRKNLLASQMRSMPLDPGLSLDELATRTNGYVAADLTALCREATYHAIHQQAQQQRPIAVTMSSFQMAMAKIGPSMHRGYQVAVEKTNWDDVGGLAEVKKQLKQAVEWPLVYKSTFLRLGLKPPRGILMYGPPGCSKTTLVKVIASISGASFLSINGAQLYSPYVGDSEKVIRETFQRARASAPSIIFLDETEAIVGKRNLGQGGGSSGDSVQERVLSTLLNEMDGVETAENVLVIGATNRPDMLDAALLRPGRFDRLIYVPPPDVDARLDILKIHSRKTPVSDEVDLRVIAMLTEYYTGADLQNICREAAMMALRRDPDAEQVTMQDFEEALATIPPSITQDILDSYNDTTAATH